MMGRYEWRTDLYDEAGGLLNERTRSVDRAAACVFATEMIPALQEAVEHEDMTEELAEILSTDEVEVEYNIKKGITVHDNWRTRADLLRVGAASGYPLTSIFCGDSIGSTSGCRAARMRFQ